MVSMSWTCQLHIQISSLCLSSWFPSLEFYQRLAPQLSSWKHSVLHGQALHGPTENHGRGASASSGGLSSSEEAAAAAAARGQEFQSGQKENYQ